MEAGRGGDGRRGQKKGSGLEELRVRGEPERGSRVIAFLSALERR